MSILQLLLPYSLAIYFIVKGSKKPLFLLGIPFLFFMGNSIFFDTAKLFHIPGSYNGTPLQFFWMLLLWIISKILLQKRDKINIKKSLAPSFADYCIIMLILITFFNYFKSVHIYPVDTGINMEFLADISLFLGYFIMKDFFASSNEEEIERFLFSLVIVNTIASVLFVLHQGLNFDIFKVNDDLITENEHGQTITRSYSFFPYLSTFTFIFILTLLKKRRALSVLLISINLLVLFFSYGRSMAIGYIIIVFLFIFFTGLKQRTFGRILRNMFLFFSIMTLGIVAIFKIFPANAVYFAERFSEISEKRSPWDTEDNLQYRFEHTGYVISKIDKESQFFGVGPVTAKQLPIVEEMIRAAWDMVWAHVIFRWGFAGFILFIALYFYWGIRSFKLFMNTTGIISELYLILGIYIVSQALESFFSFTFLADNRIATGLWYFAALSSLLGKYKSHENIYI